MNVTRDVIYDLLPAYFAGEASTDTRALVEAFFATDPEFGRMAAKFQTLLEDQRREGPAGPDAARERETFQRARLAAELPAKTRAAALAWALGGLFAWVVAYATWSDRLGFRNPGVLIGSLFVAGGLVTFVLSFFVRPESRWRELVGVGDTDLAK